MVEAEERKARPDMASSLDRLLHRLVALVQESSGSSLTSSGADKLLKLDLSRTANRSMCISHLVDAQC